MVPMVKESSGIKIPVTDPFDEELDNFKYRQHYLDHL